MDIKLKTVGKMNLGASSGDEGWKDVIQLLKEQNEKMESLARALSVIQQDMLRNNPGFVKDSVNEATEVLSGMLNTHKCLLESEVEIQKRVEWCVMHMLHPCNSCNYCKVKDKGKDKERGQSSKRRFW